MVDHGAPWACPKPPQGGDLYIGKEAVIGAGTTITASTPIIDVRGSEERALASLDAAMPIDSETMKTIEAMPKDTALAFICHIGNRSQVACEHFRKQGFTNVSNVVGGIDAWSKEIDPSVPEYGGFK